MIETEAAVFPAQRLLLQTPSILFASIVLAGACNIWHKRISSRPIRAHLIGVILAIKQPMWLYLRLFNRNISTLVNSPGIE
jgi:hypothetical protein